MSGGGPTPSNKYQLNIFLTMLVQGNTSTFICMGADLARRLAITSSFSFAALHIRAGITQKGLWRVWPCPCTMSLLPPSTTPYGSAFEVSAWSCTERRGLPGLPASPDRSYLLRRHIHVVYTRSTTPRSYSASPPGPSQFRVQGLKKGAAWPGLLMGVEEDTKNRRVTAELLLTSLFIDLWFCSSVTLLWFLFIDQWQTTDFGFWVPRHKCDIWI